MQRPRSQLDLVLKLLDHRTPPAQLVVLGVVVNLQVPEISLEAAQSGLQEAHCAVALILKLLRRCRMKA